MTPLDQAIEDWKTSIDKLAKVLGNEIATLQKDREELLLAQKNLMQKLGDDKLFDHKEEEDYNNP